MICWQMGKTSRKTKTPPGDFKVTTPKNPLINNQVVTSIKNLTTILTYLKISTCGWTFASIPNWTRSCSHLLSFDAYISNIWLTLCADLSIWLTLATWTNVVGYKLLHFINNEDQEALGYKIQWRTNVLAFHRENKYLGLCIRVWRLLK